MAVWGEQDLNELGVVCYANKSNAPSIAFRLHQYPQVLVTDRFAGTISIGRMPAPEADSMISAIRRSLCKWERAVGGIAASDSCWSWRAIRSPNL